MSAAKKINPKVKAAVPPKTANVNDFLNPKKVADKKKTAASKKEKPVSNFPTQPRACEQTSLAEMMDQLAAAETVIAAAERKAAEAKASIKSFLLEGFARSWASDGTRPDTRTWKGLRSSLDYVMTSAITFNAAKQEAIEELGIEMDDHFEVSEFKLDIKKLGERPEYLAAFMEFVGKISESDRDAYIERIFKLNANFFNTLANICDRNPDRMHEMLKILQPRANLKNIESSDKEEDMFDFVKGMKG